jgi:hypothetical protein
MASCRGELVTARTSACGTINLKFVRLQAIHRNIKLRLIAFHGGEGGGQGVNDGTQVAELLGVFGLGRFVNHDGGTQGGLGGLINGDVGMAAAALMVVGSEYQLMWLGLNAQEDQPQAKRPGSFLLFSFIQFVATLI